MYCGKYRFQNGSSYTNELLPKIVELILHVDLRWKMATLLNYFTKTSQKKLPDSTTEDSKDGGPMILVPATLWRPQSQKERNMFLMIHGSSLVRG